jgi:glycosyltransferase involved in cell wall biosynthesis
VKLDAITPLVLTWNEEPNLRRCLERLRWAREVVILDSGSTDATATIATEFPNTRLLVRPFDDHTTQWNFGVDAASTNWILSLDCDYVLCSGFEDELSKLDEATASDAFYASFRYLIFGKALRACLYPPRAVLFRKDRCRYVPDGHTQILSIPGPTAHLMTQIDHDDRKPLSRWFSSQDKYAKLESEKLTALIQFSLQDRIRRTMILGPIVVFLYTLLARRTVLDGPHGWFYAFQRTLAEIMLSLRLLEKKIGKTR